MGDLFPRMKISRPAHPEADADGQLDVRLDPSDTKQERFWTAHGWVWGTASEQVAALWILAKREEWMRQVEAGSMRGVAHVG